MKKKGASIVLVILLIIAIIIGIYFAITVNKKERKVIPDYTDAVQEENNELKLTNKEKEIVGVDTEKEEEEKEKQKIEEANYSILYKEYLEEPEEEKEKYEVIPRKEEINYEKFKEEIFDNENIDTEEIPNSFNLADKINIKVENQETYGLCWDFASITSLETYLSLNGLGDYDFSELHLDYVESEYLCGNRKIHEGGNFDFFKNYLLVSGVVPEETVPYKKNFGVYDQLYDVEEEQYEKFIGMDKVVEVTETIDFPAIYKMDNNEYTDEQINEERNLIKQHIMKNGGLYCMIVSPSIHCFNYETNSLYYGKKNEESNHCNASYHAVTIVGWDDNYSKENFLQDLQPENDGAYIALNSWGESFGNNGYFYISYEDMYVETCLSGIVSTSVDEGAYKLSDIKSQTIRNYLEENYENLFINYKGEKYISKNLISSIGFLDLKDTNCDSIDGIEIFNNLYILNLSNNNISDISPIEKMNTSTLMEINLSNNNISNISSISKIDASRLWNLDVSNNNISDISDLSNIKENSLYNINLSNNNITNVQALENFKENIGIINLMNNNIKDISTIGITAKEISLNISNNHGVKGYEKLNLASLGISNCDVEDISELSNQDKIYNLDISNNNNIKGLDKLPTSLCELVASNCGLENLNEINQSNIWYLDVSSNNIKAIDNINYFTNLYEINVSNNYIEDWEWLNEKIGMGYLGDIWKITANNCNITDISIFNNVNVPMNLDLKDNNITDISNLDNKNINEINLSNNKNLTGLYALNGIESVELNNCNISDLTEILECKDIKILSLDNNNIEDISSLSTLRNLTTLSLAHNKKIYGTLTNEYLGNLNLSDCDIDTGDIYLYLNNLYYLNIKDNEKINSIEEYINISSDVWMNIQIDEINYDEYENIKNENEKINISAETISLDNTDSQNKDSVNINSNKQLKDFILKKYSSGFGILNGDIEIKDGNITIYIEDTNKNVDILLKNTAKLSIKNI